MKTKIARFSNLRQKFYCFYFTAVVASEGVCCSRPNRCFTKISQKLSNFYEATSLAEKAVCFCQKKVVCYLWKFRRTKFRRAKIEIRIVQITSDAIILNHKCLNYLHIKFQPGNFLLTRIRRLAIYSQQSTVHASRKVPVATRLASQLLICKMLLFYYSLINIAGQPLKKSKGREDKMGVGLRGGGSWWFWANPEIFRMVFLDLPNSRQSKAPPQEIPQNCVTSQNYGRTRSMVACVIL